MHDVATTITSCAGVHLVSYAERTKGKEQEGRD